jgi:hypothetical protein
MAVTITTKFYDWDGTTWKDLSKIVFTSPNLSSPNTAGTRSHILPGGAVPLGLWYEDSSNMYRLDPSQQHTNEAYVLDYATNSGTGSFHIANSVVFEVTSGECYDCRLTAWDDVTHSTIANELLDGEYYKISAVAYNYTGTDIINPDATTTVSGAVYNKIVHGDTTLSGVNYYYGDFDMQYRTGVDPSTFGDFLIFKPMLIGIDASISYGIHDFVATFHYSYT